MRQVVSQLFFLSFLFLLLSIGTRVFAADSLPAHIALAETGVAEATAMEEEALPVSPSSLRDQEMTRKAVHRYVLAMGCKVAPLDEIESPEALALEKNADTAPADIYGLMPDAALALDTFKELVNSVGGTFDLKSAYRATAYQAHLHEIWIKWVKGLRSNRTSGCSAVREEVGAEFARHKLLLRQQPVADSDHERGLAFDAAVAMPRAAKLNGKRVTVDKLAALAGMSRPNSRRDPVHYKLRVQRPAVVSFAQNSSF